MFYKILLTTSLVTICSEATDPQKRSNQATYSHSFFREDVPLSYQYSAVHNYVPKRNAHEEPNLTKNNPLFKPVESAQKNIQYVPLPNNGEVAYQTTARSPFLKDNRNEIKPLYTSVFRSPITDHQRYEYKMSENENSAPLTMDRDHLEPKPLPMEAKNAKPFTYKPHVNHNIKIHQSPHVTSLNNYYEKIKYPLKQEAVNMEAAQQLDTGDIGKYYSIYQQGLYPEQKAVTTRNYIVSTTTENPKNSYIHVDTNNIFLPKKSFPPTPMLQESNVYLSADPRPVYYFTYKSVPSVGTHSTDRRQKKSPKYTRLNYVRFQPKNH